MKFLPFVLLASVAACGSPEREFTDAQRALGRHCLREYDGAVPDLNVDVRMRLAQSNSFVHQRTQISPVDEEGFHQAVVMFTASNAFGVATEGMATARVNNETCETSEFEFVEWQ